MNILELIPYTTNTGKQPFIEWQEKLDAKTESIVLARLARIRTGNFGNIKPIKGGKDIYEICIDYGPGYRIYYGKIGTKIIVLLVGGNKGTQTRDIAKTKQYWADYKVQKHG